MGLYKEPWAVMVEVEMSRWHAGWVAAMMVATAIPPASAASDVHDLARFSLAATEAVTVASPVPVAPELKSPVLAAVLSLTSPLTMVVVGTGITGSDQVALKYAGAALAIASPLGFGAGQSYAGDPLRGVLVGLGAPLAIGASIGLGAIVPYPQGSGMFGGFSQLWPMMVLGGATFIGYTLWAAADAAGTAVRYNREAAEIRSRSAAVQFE